MLIMKKGCTVPFPEKLREEYRIKENCIEANVGADKMKEVLEHFLSMYEEPVFFILEIPTNANDEETDENGAIKEFHKDVYYIDGCSVEEALTLLAREGDLLIQDGLSQFGFGGHESGDEIMICNYNRVVIFSGNIYKYKDFFAAHNIPETDKLTTAWDTFTRENPGSCQVCAVDGKDVYSIPERYKAWGIYLAERRAE